MVVMELPLLPAHPAVEDLVPDWARWNASEPYTVGIEEEVMLLDPRDWSLAHSGEDMLSRLPGPLAARTSLETHQAALELATSPHAGASDAAREAGALRAALAESLGRNRIRAAAAGTHPLAMWTDTRISGAARYQVIYESMRELARREPTFALHVHVGVPAPERAVVLLNALRAHLPLLHAVSANSPFWQGRDTGLASARTPIFQAFPRVGIPRAFSSYHEYVATIDQLLRCRAIPAPTFLWWDARLQPSLGTVEVRIMDAQSTAVESGALAALVVAIAHCELEDGDAAAVVQNTPELIEENRFVAARDGLDALLIDPARERRVAVRRLLEDLLARCREHAEQLGCDDALDGLAALMRENGAIRQRQIAARAGLPASIAALADRFTRS